MARADTLLQIKDAEAKASQTMKEADDKQKTIVAAARKDAIRKIQDSDDKQRSEFDAAYASEKAKVSSQREEILEKGRREARELKSKAEMSIPKAKSHLKQAFEGSI